MSTINYPAWNPPNYSSLNAFAYFELSLGVVLLPLSIFFLVKNNVNNKHVHWLKFTPIVTALLFIMMFVTAQMFNEEGSTQTGYYIQHVFALDPKSSLSEG